MLSFPLATSWMGGGRPSYLFVFIGESNSGGYGLTASATAGELAARSSVQILNNTTLAFEDLDVGTNNLIGHFVLTDNATLGWEVELANAVEAGQVGSASQVYLCKCGQGGSQAAEWEAGHAAGYWSTATTRIIAAVNLMRSRGLRPIPVVFLSLGVNDAIGNSAYQTSIGGSGTVTTDWAGWRTNIESLISRLRSYLGAATPVIATRFDSPMTVGTDVNPQLVAIAAADSRVYAVSTSGETLRDAYHWDYAGLKNVTQKLLNGWKLIANIVFPTVFGDTGTFVTRSSSNTTLTGSASGWSSGRGDKGYATGKRYFELNVLNLGGGAGNIFGLIADATTAAGAGMNGVGFANSVGSRDTVFTWNVGFTLTTSTALGALSVGTVIGIACDMDARKMWMAVNNTWIATGDPVAGTNTKATWASARTIYPAVGLINPAQVSLSTLAMTYTPPSGFSVWG